MERSPPICNQVFMRFSQTATTKAGEVSEDHVSSAGNAQRPLFVLVP